MPQEKKISWSRLCASISLLAITASCTEGESLFSPYESSMGPGWTCHITPDEFKRAGVVVERTPTGQFFFYKDIGDDYDRVTGGFRLPSLTLRSEFNVGGLSEYLKALGLDAGSLSLDLSAGSTYTARTTYGDAIKTALTGASAASALASLAQEVEGSSSEFYLIREAVAARSADIEINRTQVVRIGAGASNSPQPAAASTATASSQFDPPLGVCTISQMVTQSQMVEDETDSGLPTGAVITQRP